MFSSKLCVDRPCDRRRHRQGGIRPLECLRLEHASDLRPRWLSLGQRVVISSLRQSVQLQPEYTHVVRYRCFHHCWSAFYINLSPLYRPVPAALGSPLRRPISTSWPPTHGALKRLQRRPPSPISITILHRICYLAHKTMTLHSMPLATMITNNFCACRSFSMSQFRQNCLVLVEFRTSFFRVSTCFNGCAAAMDARLGFGTRLRWFCDRGVW